MMNVVHLSQSHSPDPGAQAPPRLLSPQTPPHLPLQLLVQSPRLHRPQNRVSYVSSLYVLEKYRQKCVVFLFLCQVETTEEEINLSNEPQGVTRTN